MKNLTKLKIKYFLIITCLLIILGIIVPTFMRYYTSVTANVVGYAKETRTSTYKIKFHENGGVGAMEEMTMNYNVSQNLTKNTFTREDYNFAGWNTEADGSGTAYTDEQEILNTTYVTGNEINLYAQWTQNNFYIVEFYANGGIGNIEKQVFEFGVPQRLKSNTFTKEDYSFWHWNTESDGTGTTYEDEEEINNLTEVSGGTVKLYAIYVREKYINNNDIVFDGTNYIDTEICLFSEKNINKDFEVSFEIKERISNGSFATMMSAMDETGTPYPGIVYRVFNSNQDQFVANATSSTTADKKYSVSNVQKVTIKRINGYIYLNINDGQDTELLNISLIKTPFDVPVTFGAGLDGNMNPFRYFTGTLSNLKVILTDPTTGSIRFNKNGGIGTEFSQIVEPNSTVTLMKNTYTREGYEFVGWNTKANGTGTSYADQESVTNIANEGETITLYAQWKIIGYIVQFNANGGTGTQFSQIIVYNATVALKKNTYTREGYEFDGWNTKADGTGTSYADQENVTNIANIDETITLYAQWKKFGYTVQFNANGGTGSMETQEFESEVAQQLNPSTFTKEGYSFGFWNTAADGSGKSYEDEEEVKNLATADGTVVNLYAIYETYNYEHEGDIVFDGTNFINTNIYLFSRKNVNKDFEISFEIKERVSTTAYATIMSSMDETGSPWPGFLFRINTTGKQYEMGANITRGSEKVSTYSFDSVTKVALRRVSGILYIKINDGNEQQFIDFSTLKKSFYPPLSFGSSLNGKLKPQRYFTGTLSNIRVTLYE